MEKIVYFVLVVYVIWYAGNIIYDLFFDNVKTVDNPDEGQLVNMKAEEDEEQKEDAAVKHISPESIGQVELPDSSDYDEADLYDQEEAPTNYNADAFRKDFEEQQQLDRYNLSEEEHKQLLAQEKLALEKENQEKKQFAEKVLASLKIPKESIVSSKSKVLPDEADSDEFDQFMKKATDHVVMVSNDKGHKTYKTTLSV